MPAPKPPAFETLSLHAGQHPDPITGARAVPIYQTTAADVKKASLRKAAERDRQIPSDVPYMDGLDNGGSRRGPSGRTDRRHRVQEFRGLAGKRRGNGNGSLLRGANIN